MQKWQIREMRSDLLAIWKEFGHDNEEDFVFVKNLKPGMVSEKSVERLYGLHAKQFGYDKVKPLTKRELELGGEWLIRGKALRNKLRALLTEHGTTLRKFMDSKGYSEGQYKDVLRAFSPRTYQRCEDLLNEVAKLASKEFNRDLFN